jgi:tetratricopeptide (TPR) repeat protein
MSFLRKLFGNKSTPSQAPAPAPPHTSKTEGEPIRVFDKFGRELLIERCEWLKLMHDNLRKHWNEPDPLAAHIIQALQDGFDAEVEEAAKQLHAIDTEPSRGATLLAVVYLQTKRPEKAEKLLVAHLKKHGEDGVLLTNLAKAQSARGRDADSLATLWHALELDPNQDNGLGWYEVIHREKEGEQGSIDALRRIADLPSSWRARLWLARHEPV